jgi:dTDP-glucose 4,6-dehydratase
MTLHGTSVLITGAGGFIGSHVTEALVRSGAKTRALVHYNAREDWGHLASLPADVLREIEVVSGDVRDRGVVRDAVRGRQVVFHLAALIGIPYSYQAAQSYVDTNVHGTLSVLEACRECGVERLVHTSTSEVYGTAQYTPIDECHPLHAQSPYAATKVAADQLAYSFFAAFGLPVVTVRPFNTYGPRQSTRAVIPTIITQALAGGGIALGSRKPVRDFLFVADTAAGFLAAAEAPSRNVLGEVINLGTGKGVTVGEVVDLVGRLVHRRLSVRTDRARYRPDKSEVQRLICDAGKARRLIHWRPRTRLEAGLRCTLDWIEAHRDQYRSGTYTI